MPNHRVRGLLRRNHCTRSTFLARFVNVYTMSRSLLGRVIVVKVLVLKVSFVFESEIAITLDKIRPINIERCAIPSRVIFDGEKNTEIEQIRFVLFDSFSSSG